MTRARPVLIEHGADPEISKPVQRRGRWPKGVSGNPAGKPKGARHAAQVALDAIGQENAEELLRSVIVAALAGDMRAAAILLDRIWPARKGRPIRLNLPAIGTAADIAKAMSIVVAEMAAGNITPEEADSVSAILNTQARALELRDLELRIQALENLNGSKP